MRLYKSSYPKLDIPNTSIVNLLFVERPKVVNLDQDRILFQHHATDHGISFRQLKDRALRFASSLEEKLNWQRDERLLIFSQNQVEYAVPVLGTLALGGIVSTANGKYGYEELLHQARIVRPKAILTTADRLELATKVAEQLGIKHILTFETLHEFWGSTNRLADIVTDFDAKEKIAFVNFSSGTTGLPKGVMLTHYNIVSNLHQLDIVDGAFLAAANDRLLAFLPFFHIYGLTNVVLMSTFSGVPAYVMPDFNFKDFLIAIQRWKITYIHLVPPVLVSLAKEKIVDDYDLTSLRMLQSGAAPLSQEVTDAVFARIHIKIKQGYGLTETSPLCLTSHWGYWNIPGTTGSLAPNIEARIVDNESGLDADYGELWVRGPNVFKGYWENPEATKECITEDGFFKTGDIVIVDEYGYFYVKDRLKELIKYNGFQVVPAELEGFLLSHEYVHDAGVVGYFDKNRNTELPVAFIVLNDAGKEIHDQHAAQAIKDFVKNNLTHHKQLRGGVYFVESIPKNPSGKILRRILREDAKTLKEKKTEVRSKL